MYLAEPKTKWKGPTKKSTPQTGCSANSFMIDDGVCDEATNVERCLFDGNDCCLVNKSTPLCKVCTCKKKVDMDSLIKKTGELKVKASKTKKNDQLSNEIYFSTSVKDVESQQVCTIVCMEMTEVKASYWTFNGTSKVCTCSELDFVNVCYNHQVRLLMNALVPFEKYIEHGLLKSDEVAVFVSLERTCIFRCGNAYIMTLSVD